MRWRSILQPSGAVFGNAVLIWEHPPQHKLYPEKQRRVEAGPSGKGSFAGQAPPHPRSGRTGGRACLLARHADPPSARAGSVPRSAGTKPLVPAFGHTCLLISIPSIWTHVSPVWRRGAKSVETRFCLPGPARVHRENRCLGSHPAPSRRGACLGVPS